MVYNSIEKLLECKIPWEFSFDLSWEKGGYNLIDDPIERYFIYKAISVLYNNLPKHVKPKFNSLSNEQKNAEIKMAYEKMTEDYRTTYPDSVEFCKSCYDCYGNIPDCDGSGGDGKLAIDLYEKLWSRKMGACETAPFLGLEDTAVLGDALFGGDTMNSAQITLNKLFETTEFSLIHKAEKKGRNNSIMYCLHLYIKFGTDFFKVLGDNYVSLVTNYISSYHTLGNFVLVPGGFNGYRSSKTYDFWDSSLVWLKKYGFTSKHAMFKIENFNRYINYFFLWDYVEKIGNDYKIKPLFCSHDKIEEGENLEKSKANWTNVTTEEAEEFMKNAVHNIKWRGIFMTALLRLKTSTELADVSDNYFKYIQSEDFLSAVHENGFKKAADELILQLDGIENNDPNADVNRIRADLSKIIDRKELK